MRIIKTYFEAVSALFNFETVNHSLPVPFFISQYLANVSPYSLSVVAKDDEDGYICINILTQLYQDDIMLSLKLLPGCYDIKRIDADHFFKRLALIKSHGAHNLTARSIRIRPRSYLKFCLPGLPVIQEECSSEACRALSG
jgi:hypothetical protein